MSNVPVKVPPKAPPKAAPAAPAKVPPKVAPKAPPAPAAAAPETTEPRKGGRTKEVRPYKDSPAGHFSDRVRLMSESIVRIKDRTEKWTGADGKNPLTDSLSLAEESVKSLHDELVKLHDAGFRPTGARRGPRKAPIAPDTQVYIEPSFLPALSRAFKNIESKTLFSAAHTQPGDAGIVVEIREKGKPAQTVGIVPRKYISDAPFPAPEATAAA